MTVDILLRELERIRRASCPCICCRNRSVHAEATLEAYRHLEPAKAPALDPKNSQVVLRDAAEGRELHPHPAYFGDR